MADLKPQLHDPYLSYWQTPLTTFVCAISGMYGHDDIDGAATIPEKKLGFKIGSCKVLQQANIKLYLLLKVNFTIPKLHWINFYIFWKRLFSILCTIYH